MAAINTIVLSGRLTDAPSLRYTQSGVAVASGSVAVDDGWGENKKTYFFKYTAWRHTAEYLANYAKKGHAVVFSGKLTENVWETDDGQKRREAVILVQEALLNSKGGNGQEDGSSGATGQNSSSQGGFGVNDNMLGTPVDFSPEDLPF